MSNLFYTASGNPANGSEGLSALMRGEFLLIQTAFDLVPRFSTTGLFDTVFNQLGNYTFTLPGFSGTLATTANIATETTRATAAEAVLTTAVATEATARTAAIGVETARATAAEALLAPLAAPVFTGRPSIQNTTFTSYYLKNTASATDAKIFDWSTDSTSIDFRFVKDDFSAATGWLKAVRSGYATVSVTVTAPTISLVGTVTAATAAPGTNTTQVATTAFVAAAAPFQTLNNVTASRALATTYTNTTGNPMFLNVETTGSGTPFSIRIFVNGAQTQAPGGTGSGVLSVSFVLPPGATYRVDSLVGSNALTSWIEVY